MAQVPKLACPELPRGVPYGGSPGRGSLPRGWTVYTALGPREDEEMDVEKGFPRLRFPLAGPAQAGLPNGAQVCPPITSHLFTSSLTA